MGSVDLPAIQSAKSEASRRKGAVGANWDKIIVPAVFAVIVLIFYSIDSKFLSATNILNIMSVSNSFPCFKRFDIKDIKSLFGCSMSDPEREVLVTQLIESSLNSTKTYLYDTYQKYTNDIEA